MSSDPQRGPAADVDAEQEVDFGRYWRAIAARWWLPVGGLVAGLVIGYLVSLGTHSSTYKATAQVYLGQPLARNASAARHVLQERQHLLRSLRASEGDQQHRVVRVERAGCPACGRIGHRRTLRRGASAWRPG